MNLRETYNRIGHDWWKEHETDFWWHKGTDIFVSKLLKGGSILDVGCGGGTASTYLIKRGIQVTGIDFSEKMIEICKREATKGKFFVLDMMDLEKIQGEFDGIYAKASILHLPKKKVPEILKIFRNKLNNEGVLYVAVKEATTGQKDEQVKEENDFGYVYERFFSFFTLSEMEKYFTETGFDIIFKQITDIGKTRWIEIIGRKNW